MFAAVTKSERGYKMRNCVKPLSYTRVREIFIEVFTGIVDDIKKYGLHSLRSGGAWTMEVGIGERRLL